MVDSHNHIHFRAFRQDLPEVMHRAASGGIRAMLTVGIDPRDCSKALDIARIYQGVYVSLGIHPQNGGRFAGQEVYGLRDLCSEPVVAIGETGFDLYRTPESEDAQKDLFLAHIDLARELKLPLIIHDRAAHVQTMAVLNDRGAWSLGGVFHCFSGDAALAREVVRKGFLVSIPGVVTFRNSTQLKEVVQTIPLECLLVETDAPYLTPEPFRGKRNEPLFTAQTVEEIARIKGVEPDEVARQTTVNFCRLFLAGKQLKSMDGT
jgi:TatD DNase family protein